MTEVKISNSEGYKTEIISNGHILFADEHEEQGGTNTGMSPYKLLLAAIGSCKAMTMRMYADRKKFPLKDIYINLSQSKIYAEDCINCETRVGKIDEIKIEIRLTGNLSEEQRERIFEISEKCPVHRTLTSEISINSNLLN